MKPWLLAILTANRKLVSRTFTSSTTFTVPYGVTQLVSLTGVGGATTSASVVSVAITYSPTGTGTPGSSATWANFQSVKNSNQTAMAAGGSCTIQQSYSTVYSDGTNDGATIYPTTFTDVVAGTAYTTTSGGWASSGPITSSGEADITYQQYGGSTSGFGKTFAGSTGSGAATATYNNVAVTENTPYNLVIPTGGSITITYYQ
jgi:hypothetical protein